MKTHVGPGVDRARASAAVEVVPGKLYALGGAAPLDGRLSWAPEVPGRYQAASCYLLKEGSQALLVDSGLPAFADAILEQLAQILPPGSSLRVFLTRPELDAVANLPLIRERYEIDDAAVLSGGSDNPFDSFNEAGAMRSRSSIAAAAAAESPRSILRTTGFDLGPNRPIRIVVPKLRFLPTYWPFDAATKTLFTSDIFTHVDQVASAGVEVVESDGDRASREDVSRHLFCKFWWLPGATTGEFIDDLVPIFDTLQPEIVAPTHGCVLKGKGVVQRHLELLLDVLRDCDRR